MHATYGGEHEETWVELRCSWCTGVEADGSDPCCEACEALAVRAARTKRIVGLVDAIQRACRLRAQYAAERIPGDLRILAVDGVVADYDRQIHETVQAQQADDGMEVAS